MNEILLALPLSKDNGSHVDNAQDGNTTHRYLPLSVVEVGASYCNRVDQYGRPIVYLKLGKLDEARSGDGDGSGDGSDAGRRGQEHTPDDYLYSMLYTLER
jgi:hypothetical protein